MNYDDLKSLVSATKKSFPMRASSDSFGHANKRGKPYITPNFSEAIETKKPIIILISAVGATGKTALAQVLSNESGLPLLDLGKHKPVGDNTLTGLLTSTFRTEDLSEIFLGLAQGTYGVIIDGVDEGRSKTTEKAFEAFLDDIARLCVNSENTSFVLLGRTKILDDCWLYLSEKGISTGLITISSFDLTAHDLTSICIQGLRSRGFTPNISRHATTFLICSPMNLSQNSRNRVKQVQVVLDEKDAHPSAVRFLTAFQETI